MFETCYDCVIVGQGIAGSLVAMQGLELGLNILVIDEDKNDNASSVAAGLVEAVSGKRWTLSYRANEWMPFAKDVYQTLERRLNLSFINDLESYRVVLDDKQEQCIQKRLRDPILKDYIGDFITKLPFDLLCQKGAYKIRESFSIKAPLLLNAIKIALQNRQVLRNETLDLNQIDLSQDQVLLRLKEERVHAKSLIFCQGHQLENNPFFQDLDFRPSRGDVLTFSSAKLKPHCHIVQKEWLVPIDEDRYRFGATYDWPPYDERELKIKNKDRLVSSIEGWGIKDINLLDHQYAFRCNLSIPHPLLQSHKAHPQLFVLGALGSKGFMSAPYMSDHFYQQHLIPKLASL